MKTVVKAIAVLRAFERRGTWGVSELARDLDMPKSVVHRLVATLAESGFLDQVDESGSYVLGMRLVTLARHAARRTTLGSVAHRHLVELAAEARSSAYLSVLRGHRHVCLDIVESPSPVRTVVQLGDTGPLYAGAGGKVILSFQSDEFINAVLAEPMTRYTENTDIDPMSVRKEIDRIREQGWAHSSGEITPGTATVAAPIYDDTGRVVASVNVTTSSMRMRRDGTARYIALTRGAANALSRDLGYRLESAVDGPA